jgi:hypothetical protein
MISWMLHRVTRAHHSPGLWPARRRATVHTDWRLPAGRAAGLSTPRREPAQSERFSGVTSAEGGERMSDGRASSEDDKWAWARRAETTADPGSTDDGAALFSVGGARLDPRQEARVVANTHEQALDHARALAEELSRALALAQALSSSADRADHPSPTWSDAGRPTVMSRGRYAGQRDGDDWPTTTMRTARSWFLDGPESDVASPTPPPPAMARSRVPKALPSSARPRFPLLPAVRLAVLFVAGAVPVLAISLQVFDVLPLAVTARFVVLPLTLAAAMVMVGPSVQGAWAVRGSSPGSSRSRHTTRCASPWRSLVCYRTSSPRWADGCWAPIRRTLSLATYGATWVTAAA